jgi:hypothetical protein
MPYKWMRIAKLITSQNIEPDERTLDPCINALKMYIT